MGGRQILTVISLPALFSLLNLISEHSSEPPPSPPLTLHPDVDGRGDGEHQEEEDEDEGLQVVGRHPFHSKQNGPQQLPLEERKSK